ncbi:MAG: putative toxin-antitoxin system toxin component, PIN family [Dehalococcoidia bacterium]
MYRVVFDTVVFVRALINPYSVCGHTVFLDSAPLYRLYLSRPILIEILEVLRPPELTRKFRPMAGLDSSRVLDILSFADVVEPVEIPSTSRDEKDDKFLAAAIAAKADFLVSEDHDLLVLAEFQGIRIVRCAEFLRIIQADVER